METSPRIALVIDDDPDFRRLMELRLRSFLPTFTISTAADLAEARTVLGTLGRPVELVVIDQHLSDGTGSEFLKEGLCVNSAVLAVSSDSLPELPAETIRNGAHYFLSKSKVGEPMVRTLVEALLERKELEREIERLRTEQTVLSTVKTLVSTLRHEINNPLGAVLGAAYLLKSSEHGSPELTEAARLVEESGKRIKHVLDRLCEAIQINPTQKAKEEVFQIPGDKPWNES